MSFACGDCFVDPHEYQSAVMGKVSENKVPEALLQAECTKWNALNPHQFSHVINSVAMTRLLMSDPHYCSDDEILDALAIINPEHENPNAPVFRPYLDKQEFLCCRFNQHLLISVSDTHALNQSAYKDNRTSSKDKRICPEGVHTNIAELDISKQPGTCEVAIRGLWIDPLTNINAKSRKRC